MSFKNGQKVLIVGTITNLKEDGSFEVVADCKTAKKHYNIGDYVSFFIPSSSDRIGKITYFTNGDGVGTNDFHRATQVNVEDITYGQHHAFYCHEIHFAEEAQIKKALEERVEVEKKREEEKLAKEKADKEKKMEELLKSMTLDDKKVLLQKVVLSFQEN